MQAPQLMLVAAALLLAGTAPAQHLAATQVPVPVAANFKAAFPKVKAVKWEKEGADYEAGFNQGKAEMSAVFTAVGVLKETETEMAVNQLPAPVAKALAANYKAYKITEAAKIVTAATGATTYEAEVTRAGKHHDVLFNADGTEVAKK